MKNVKSTCYQVLFLLTGFVLVSTSLMAQNGGLAKGAIGKGIKSASTELADVAITVGDLMLPICLIMGFVGGIQCASKFFNNDPDFKKSIINWGSAIIFAGVVGLVLNAAFKV